MSVQVAPSSKLEGAVPVQTLSPKIESFTEVSVTLKIADNAPLRDYELWVVTDGGSSNKLKFKVVAAPEQ